MKHIIGLDAKRILRNCTGLGSYGRNLANALSLADSKDLFLLYAPDSGHDDLREQVRLSDNMRFVYPQGHPCRLRRDLWRTHGIVDYLRRDGVTLYHGLSGELPIGLRKAGIKGVVTIHDLIFLRHPEYYNPLDVMIYRWKFHRTLREADRVIAISECTKKDILHYSNFPEDRIDVVYQSCDTRFRQPVGNDKIAEVRQKYYLPTRYILNVGSIEERKNVLLAVKALEQLPEDMHLVVVGRRTKYTVKVEQYAQKHGLSGRLHILNGVPNDDLPAIYHAAEVFVYPSRYEGFGIPIIEAIQTGLSVVAATGSCLEEAGGPDSLYVSPDEPSAMASAIERAIYNKVEMVGRSLSYIQRFENKDVASQILSVYNDALSI